ncbi:MAG: hypothetical protein K2P23_09475, partial [Lachnospiraceae bacterium]|nr:hypothetical protein [Lachnospiraceae bacterium]
MEDKKMSFMAMIILKTLAVFLYITYIVWMFWCQPFVACAAEKDNVVPGGSGNTVVVSVVELRPDKKQKLITQCTMESTEDSEIVAFIQGSWIFFQHCIPADGVYYGIQTSRLVDCTGYSAGYINDKLDSSNSYTKENPLTSFFCKVIGDHPEWSLEYNLTGCKLFKDKESMIAYVDSGSL